MACTFPPARLWERTNARVGKRRINRPTARARTAFATFRLMASLISFLMSLQIAHNKLAGSCWHHPLPSSYAMRKSNAFLPPTHGNGVTSSGVSAGFVHLYRSLWKLPALLLNPRESEPRTLEPVRCGLHIALYNSTLWWSSSIALCRKVSANQRPRVARSDK